jgi:hypothetical protein
MTYYGTMHLIWSCNRLLADSIILEVVPDSLVGVKFRRIRRQKEQAKPLFNGFGFNKLGNALGLVCRMTIDNQKSVVSGKYL